MVKRHGVINKSDRYDLIAPKPFISRVKLLTSATGSILRILFAKVNRHGCLGKLNI